MTQEQLENCKARYLSTCRQYIKREGLEPLLAHLEKGDFFQAPTSTKYHLNVPGGLCLHSLNVFETAVKICDNVLKPAVESGVSNFKFVPDMESIAIATLFHDFCKIGLYHPCIRYKKDEQNNWVTYNGYNVEDNFPFGHGEKSCFLIERFLRLKPEELLAIRWHMGMFDMGEQGSSQRMSFYRALEMYPLVSIVHSADMLSSHLLEQTYKP